MRHVVVLGAGKIGRTVAEWLARSNDYYLTVADSDVNALARLGQHPHLASVCVDVTHPAQLCALLAGDESTAKFPTSPSAVISALSYRHNLPVAQSALTTGVSYFDLTEDVATTRAVRELARDARSGQIFMPQCGLAPGFIAIVGNHLTRSFDRVDRLHMRVGALPQFPTGGLQYNLTWSTDGLINEYCNPCDAIVDGDVCQLRPLEGLEHFSLDGIDYEAFNTSGGLGTLCETFAGRIRELNYKTVRYPGHQHYMRFLLEDLRLARRREILQEILESAIPITWQDVVVTFCSVSGWKNGLLIQRSDARKLYAREVDGQTWSGIQIATASGVCAVVDLATQGRLPDRGFVRQEEVSLVDFLANRFGQNYRIASEGPARCETMS